MHDYHYVFFPKSKCKTNGYIIQRRRNIEIFAMHHMYWEQYLVLLQIIFFSLNIYIYVFVRLCFFAWFYA